MKAVIFCVETNKHANTDWVYITETLKRFYNTDQIKTDRIYMGTKSKYKSRSVIEDISSWKKVYRDNLVVVYCIDTDNYESNPNQKKDFAEITKYCNDRSYELVWFCHDVEEVYLGNSIHNNAKKEESIRFLKSKSINGIDEVKLSSNQIRSGYSNIMLVLDRFMGRKG